MKARNGFSRSVMSAQPGYFVLRPIADPDEGQLEFDEQNFERASVVAWCVDVWTHPEDEFRVMSVTHPVTVEGDVQGYFAIIDPAGIITRPFYQSYPCERDAMADIWRDMVRDHEHFERYPFLAEPERKAA